MSSLLFLRLIGYENSKQYVEDKFWTYKAKLIYFKIVYNILI